MHKSFFLLIFCFIAFASTAQTKPGYNIQFKITGLKDTTAYLGYYYAESTYVRDTARVNSKGEFFFDGKQALPHGIYFLVLDKTRLFDFVIGSTQHFRFETNTEDYIKNMVVKNDPDNKLYFESLLFNMERNKEAEPFVKILQDSTMKDEAKKKEARAEFGKVNDKVMAYQDDLIKKFPTTMTARWMKTTKQIHIPDPPKRVDGAIDSTFALRYYRQHFFDNFDLSDDAMIRLPKTLYKEKVNEYLDRLYPPQADTLIKAIKNIVAKAKKNQETYKYMVFNLIVKYQTPEFMGLDAIFVFLNDEYFANGEMNFWANEKYRKNIKEHADNLRKSLVGQTGKNLIMQDQNFQPRSMYDIRNKYTILYIFDPDCAHCKTETPKLVRFYNEYKKKFDIEVYAVSADSSMKKMRDYIRTMNMPWITVNGPRTYVGSYHDFYDAQTTPTIYILDDKKKIIAKKPPIEKLPEFFTNYEKFQKRRPEPTSKSTP